MKTRNIKITYWVFTLLFAVFSIMDGFGGITKQQAGIDVMLHLGYPIYAMQIMGTAKILGAIAIVQQKFNTIKEWAYAGFAINFIGAFASRAFVGDGGMWLVFPVILLAFMFIPYFLWKKLESAKANTAAVVNRNAYA